MLSGMHKPDDLNFCICNAIYHSKMSTDYTFPRAGNTPCGIHGGTLKNALSGGIKVIIKLNGSLRIFTRDITEYRPAIFLRMGFPYQHFGHPLLFLFLK